MLGKDREEVCTCAIGAAFAISASRAVGVAVCRIGGGHVEAGPKCNVVLGRKREWMWSADSDDVLAACCLLLASFFVSYYQ